MFPPPWPCTGLWPGARRPGRGRGGPGLRCALPLAPGGPPGRSAGPEECSGPGHDAGGAHPNVYQARPFRPPGPCLRPRLPCSSHGHAASLCGFPASPSASRHAVGPRVGRARGPLRPGEPAYPAPAPAKKSGTPTLDPPARENQKRPTLQPSTAKIKTRLPYRRAVEVSVKLPCTS